MTHKHIFSFFDATKLSSYRYVLHMYSYLKHSAPCPLDNSQQINKLLGIILGCSGGVNPVIREREGDVGA